MAQLYKHGPDISGASVANVAQKNQPVAVQTRLGNRKLSTVGRDGNVTQSKLTKVSQSTLNKNTVLIQDGNGNVIETDVTTAKRAFGMSEEDIQASQEYAQQLATEGLLTRNDPV